MDNSSVRIGIGDSFTCDRNHWEIINVKEGKFICRNKNTGAVVEFSKEAIEYLMKRK